MDLLYFIYLFMVVQYQTLTMNSYVVANNKYTSK